jgi:hypothetical protein
MTSTPSVTLSGEKYVNSGLTLDVANVPGGSTVACRWFYPNGYGQTSEFTGCSYTPSKTFSSGALEYQVTVTKDGTTPWSSGRVSAGAITLRPMTNTPVFNLLGNKVVGSTLQVDVGTIDEGASISCSWDSLGSYSNTNFSRSCSYTPTRRFSSGGLNVTVTVSKSGFASWSSGYINVGAITD